MSLHPSSPLRTKNTGKKSHSHGDWVLKKNQDCTEAVIGNPQPTKMRLTLTSLQEPNLDRETFYDLGFGLPFDWNDESDISLLNEWREEKIQKYTTRSMGQMERTKAVRNQVVRDQAVEKRDVSHARAIRKQSFEETSNQLLSMISHGKQVKAFRVQERRLARNAPAKPGSSRRQNQSNSNKTIEFLPVDLDKVASITPEQQENRQKVQMKNWNMTQGLIERSFEYPDREIGIDYNL